MILNNLALIVCLVGLVLYLVTDNGKVSEVGRIAYWTGLVFVLWFGLHR